LDCAAFVHGFPGFSPVGHEYGTVGTYFYKSEFSAFRDPPSLAPPVILMSNKDYFSQHSQPQQQQYYPPQGAIFSRRYRCCVIDGSVCTQGHRLVKVTTPSSLSRRTRATVVSLAISHSHSLKRFMCASEVLPGVGTPTHAELCRVVSSPHPRRRMTFAWRAWQVYACVVVRKVRGFAVTSLPYRVLTRSPYLLVELCACLF
jgi:hypothetical protein